MSAVVILLPEQEHAGGGFGPACCVGLDVSAFDSRLEGGNRDDDHDRRDALRSQLINAPADIRGELLECLSKVLPVIHDAQEVRVLVLGDAEDRKLGLWGWHSLSFSGPVAAWHGALADINRNAAPESRLTGDASTGERAA